MTERETAAAIIGSDCRAPEDQTAFVQVRGDLESLWFAVLGLVVGGLLGFAAGWLSAADFIHG